MRLIACLSWYDEDPASLTELIAGLANAGVDHLVAVDGAYFAYPGGRSYSGRDQSAAVTAAATGAGMGVSLHVPQGRWLGNEIEKRTFMFTAALAVAEHYVDWLWIADGDETIRHAPADLKQRLTEATREDVAEVMLIESVTGPAAEFDDEGRTPIRKLFRAIPGLRVVENHYTYEDQCGRRLWGDGQTDVVLDLLDLQVEHHRESRPAARDRRRNEYYERRMALGLEA